MIDFSTSKTTLKVLAAIVWYIGVIVLSQKSYFLLNTAYELNSNFAYIISALISGLIIGVIKIKYLFIKLCLNNVSRINGLTTPKLWQFYRPHFFIFLISMILLGDYLTKLAQGNYIMLISMAIIELSIAVALLGSSYYFWKRNN